MSRIAQEMRSRMDGMSETEFSDMMGLSKAAFLDHLAEAAADEARCVARPGAPAPDFTAHRLGGDGAVSADMLSLSDLRGAPVSLIFGCYTCPIFRQQTDRMKQLIAEHGAAVRFLFVYVREAHPTDGWNTRSNREAGIAYAQPVTLEERAKVAADWRRAFAIGGPLALDWPDNRINADYAGSPERLYVLDAGGVVTFRSEQGPYRDDHLEDWAAALRQAAGGA